MIRACRLSRNYFVGALSARNDDFEVRMLSDLPDGIFSSHWIYSPLVTAHAKLGLRRPGFPLCETSLVCCSRLIRCADYGSFGLKQPERPH